MGLLCDGFQEALQHGRKFHSGSMGSRMQAVIGTADHQSIAHGPSHGLLRIGADVVMILEMIVAAFGQAVTSGLAVTIEDHGHLLTGDRIARTEVPVAVTQDQTLSAWAVVTIKVAITPVTIPPFLHAYSRILQYSESYHTPGGITT